MPLVGCELGITMHIGDPGHNEYMRFTLKVEGIDTEQPVAQQLDRAATSLHDLVSLVEAQLEQKIEQELGRRV